MEFNELKELLIAENVYDRIKEREDEVFALIPELKVCKGFDQKNSWHIYDVYEHILHVVDGVAPVLPIRLTAVFHDVGKPLAFHVDEEGVGHFFGHWDRSVDIFQKYVPLLQLSTAEADLITALIFYHDINVDRLQEDELSQLVERIGRENLHMLFAIKRADLLAQSPAYHGMLTKIDEQEKRMQNR